jgi:hypothetical protein
MDNDRAVAAAAPRVAIHILRGKSASKSREMSGPVLLIGSDHHCDIQMRSVEVAAQHCLITSHNGKISLRQLDPGFPVLRNGVATEAAELDDGDTLTIGPFELGVSIKGGSRVPTRAKDTADAEAEPAELRPARPTGATDLPRLARMLAQKPRLRQQRSTTPTPNESHSLARRQEKAENTASPNKPAGEFLANITSELIQLAQRQQRLDRQKSKLARVRRQLMDKLRDRRRVLDEQTKHAENQAADLAARRRLLEREVAHWKQIGDVLGRRALEQKAADDALARRHEEIERRQADLAAAAGQLETERLNVQARYDELEQFEKRLEARNAEIERLELSAKAAKQSADDERQEFRRQVEQLQQHAAQLSERADLVHKQQQYLQNLAKSLEEQRQALGRWERDLADRVAAQEQAEAILRAEQADGARLRQSIEARQAELGDRERRLEAAAAELAQRNARSAADAEELRRRTVELQEQSQAAATALERDRAQFERDRKSHEEAVSQLQQVLTKQRDEIRKERTHVEQLADQNNRKAIFLEQETKRLEQLASELKRSEQSLRECERQWKLQVEDASQQLREHGRDLNEYQARLETQSSAHRRHLQRLRAAARRLAERRKQTRAVRAPVEQTESPKLKAAIRAPEITLETASIVDVVHSGTLATTYRVRLADHARPVALRLLAPQWSRDKEMRRSYEIAVASLISFRHPNVVAAYAFARTFDRYGMVLEFVEGASLDELAEFSIPPRAVVEFACQAISGLAAAQRAGFVHHTLRPSQLLVEPSGNIKLIGIGEAPWCRNAYRCEQGRRLVPYLAPEAQRPDACADIRADLYSIGRIIWSIATGASAAPADEKPILPPGYPSSFAPLLARITAEDPGRRCRSLRQILEELDALRMSPEMSGETWPDLPDVLTRIAARRTRRAA